MLPMKTATIQSGITEQLQWDGTERIRYALARKETYKVPYGRQHIRQTGCAMCIWRD